MENQGPQEKMGHQDHQERMVCQAHQENVEFKVGISKYAPFSGILKSLYTC